MKRFVLVGQKDEPQFGHKSPGKGYAMQAAMETLTTAGLEVPQRPADPFGESVDPKLPHDITTITFEEVGRLHGEFNRMIDYIEGLVGLADVDAAEYDSYVEQVSAKVRLSKSGTAPDKSAKVLNDPRYLEAHEESMRKSAAFKILRARLRGYEKCSAALSREMSRREAELSKRL